MSDEPKTRSVSLSIDAPGIDLNITMYFPGAIPDEIRFAVLGFIERVGAWQAVQVAPVDPTSQDVS